jgi:glycerol kinase
VKPPRYVAALDQGTTSSRCILYDHDGRMVAIAQREHHQHFPEPGLVEHDATEIWGIVQRIIRQALDDAGAQPKDIVALGVTNQRETMVVWDRHTGVPVHRAIVWQDTRSAEILRDFSAAVPAAEILRRTGLPMASYFSAAKLRWLLDSDPVIRDRAEDGELLFGTMDTWITWNLTGGRNGGLHVTDVTNASRTMLMNLETLDWDQLILDGFRIPRRMLPEIRSTLGDFGTTVDPVPGIRIGALVGDQQAALFGQAGFDAGAAKCTFGTGGFLLLNTGTQIVRSTHGLITTVATKSDGEPATYALEGSMAVAGGLVQWCRDNLHLIRSPAEIETLAATVTDNGGCYVVPAFSGLFAPYWRPQAKGLLIGLTSYVTRGHIARAVLEATAWQTRDVVDAMNADGGVPASRLVVDGGMTSDNLLMQLVADALDIPVVRPQMAETVALGAAYSAGLAQGYWPDRSTLRRNWHRAAEWQPQADPQRRERELGQWRRAVALAIAWGDPDADVSLPNM